MTPKFVPVALGVALAGTVQVTPAGEPATPQLKATLPLSPLRDFSWTLRIADAPALTERSPIVVEVRLKSFTASVTVFERTIPSAEPVMLTIVFTVGVMSDEVKVTTDWLPGVMPGVTVSGVAEQVMPAAGVEHPTAMGSDIPPSSV